MKIDINGGYGAYRKTISNEATTVKTSTAKGATKTADTDTVQISRGNSSKVDKGFTTLKANLHRDINQSASSERIEQLRASIKGGTYRVPTETLVDSILAE